MSGGSRSGGVGAGRALLFLTLLAGAIEFLLGMDVNLYIPCVPDGPMHVFASDPCGSQPILEAHVVVGVVLGVLAIGLLLWAARRRIPGFLGPVFGGLLGVVIAAVGGYEYLATATATSTGSPADSFLMAVGFLIAFGSYMSASYVLRDYARSGGAAIRWLPPASSNPPP
jgi:hypothetical protein